MTDEKTEPVVETPEQKIARLEARLARIEEIEKRNSDAEGATFRAPTTKEQELQAKSIEIYGELSPFWKPQKA